MRRSEARANYVIVVQARDRKRVSAVDEVAGGMEGEGEVKLLPARTCKGITQLSGEQISV